MKKLLLLIILPSLLLSCIVEDPEENFSKPTISLSENNISGKMGDEVSVIVILTAEAGITSATVNGQDIASCSDGTTICTHVENYTIENSNDMVEFVYLVVDEQGQTATETLTISQGAFELPTIVLNNLSFTGIADDEAKITGTVNAEAGIKSLTLNGEEITGAVTQTSFAIDDTYVLKNSNETIEFVYMVTDNVDNTATITFSVVQTAVYSLYELISQDAELSELKSLVEADSELLNMVKGTTAYTLFAPSNGAFEKLLASIHIAELTQLDPELISTILKYHFINGTSSIDELIETTVTTFQGEELTVNSDGTILNGGTDNSVEVLKADEEATNGMIHKVETVLIPPTVFNNISSTLGTVAEPIFLSADFADLVDIITEADKDIPNGEPSIRDMLSAPDTPITVFFPVNQIFEATAAVAGITKEQLLGSLSSSPSVARGFILNHVTSEGFIMGDDLVNGKTITMLSGNSYIVVEIDVSSDVPLGIVFVDVADVNAVSVIYAVDILNVNNSGAGTNGSIHVSSIID